jgi:hypothetical protein
MTSTRHKLVGSSNPAARVVRCQHYSHPIWRHVGECRRQRTTSGSTKAGSAPRNVPVSLDVIS